MGDTVLYVSIGSLVVAIVSSGVSIVSAKIAWDAKKQAQKAAALSFRFQAIDHIRNAMDDTIRHGNITTRTTDSIQQAAHLSAVVFDSSITKTIERAYGISLRIQHTPSERQDDQYHKSKDELDRLLREVLRLMKKEASLEASQARLIY